jgi:hypothetical protein
MMVSVIRSIGLALCSSDMSMPGGWERKVDAGFMNIRTWCFVLGALKKQMQSTKVKAQSTFF